MTEGSVEEAGSLVLESHFAIVPEWIIDADISDCAYRLYSVLLRYGQSSGRRMPGRATLATRLRKASTDTVDRALKELEAIGAVVVERRRKASGEHLTNRYHLMSTPPAGRRRDQHADGASEPSDPPTQETTGGGGRIRAATGGRTDAAGVAADLRPAPGVLTQKIPPPDPLPAPPAVAGEVPKPGPAGLAPQDVQLLTACGIQDLAALAAQCQRQRRRLGRPPGPWSADRLLAALREAVTDRGWPAEQAAAALRVVAADPGSHSPRRVACPGPWWTTAASPSPVTAEVRAELDVLEARLLEADGARVWAQQHARQDLLARGLPVSRLEVARRACQLLEEAESVPC